MMDCRFRLIVCCRLRSIGVSADCMVDPVDTNLIVQKSDTKISADDLRGEVAKAYLGQWCFHTKYRTT